MMEKALGILVGLSWIGLVLGIVLIIIKLPTDCPDGIGACLGEWLGESLRAYDEARHD